MEGETGAGNAMAVFDGKKIRRVWHKGEWYFSVVDVIAALTDSPTPRQYWGKMKEREFNELELYPIWVQLKLPSLDGKYYETDCASTEALFRIIQSIPSPKAEPFKLWLAKVGYERVQEIQDPELAQKRMKELYKQKGYSDEWIEKRVRGMAIRHELTDEWKNREVKQEKEFAILTNEISLATFGKTVEDYKRLKKLGSENLRDHMDELELIFGMLGEKVTTEITRTRDTQGFRECRGAANEGGGVAGRARADAEKSIGRPIVTGENYLDVPEKVKRRMLASKPK